VKGSLCKAGKWVSNAILSNQESSSGSAVSPSAKAWWDNASGPLCLSAGTCTRAKSKRRIPWIHRFMAALGWRSGSFSIPLMYLASTSTRRFLTPIICNLQCWRARYNPNNSNFGCEYLDSRSLMGTEP